MSFDKSFEIQRSDQDDWKFILQANYFHCHLKRECTNTQRANVQRGILPVAQNYAKEWYHRFFKTLFECLDSNVPLDESFICRKLFRGFLLILVDSSSWRRLLVNTKSIKDGVSNEPICPQSSDVHQALHVLREYMLFSDHGEFIHKCSNEISVLVENELSAKLRQADI